MAFAVEEVRVPAFVEAVVVPRTELVGDFVWVKDFVVVVLLSGDDCFEEDNVLLVNFVVDLLLVTGFVDEVAETLEERLKGRLDEGL